MDSRFECEVVLRNAKLAICPSDKTLDSRFIMLSFDQLDGVENVQARSSWHVSLGCSGTGWMKPVSDFTPCADYLGHYTGASYGDIRVKVTGHEYKTESQYGKFLVGDIIEPAGLTFEDIFWDACTSSRAASMVSMLVASSFILALREWGRSGRPSRLAP